MDQGYPELHGEFQTSNGYIVISCVKIKQKKMKTEYKYTWQGMIQRGLSGHKCNTCNILIVLQNESLTKESYNSNIDSTLS